MKYFYFAPPLGCLRFSHPPKNNSCSLIGLPFLLISILVATPRPSLAQSIGFEGDFATWNSLCPYDINDYYCGYIDYSTRSTVNTPSLDQEPPGGTNPSTLGITLWQNSPRSSDYIVNFDLFFVPNTADASTVSGIAFYQVGSTRTDFVGFGIYSSIDPVSVPAGQAFSFGIELTGYGTGFLAAGSDIQLEISNFSATPYTPVTAPLVPAPLPAIGAASLFLGSRRLKKRMVRQRVLRLARRNLAPALRSVLPG